MKKNLYLCILFLVSNHMMAQIYLNDDNWFCVFQDEFIYNIWNTWNKWEISNPYGKYLTFIPEWPSGVSRGSDEHHIYQRENCQFNNNGTLRLVSTYEGGPNNTPLHCGDYDIPPEKTCDATHSTLYYFSGKIESDVKYLYGYFELRCSLPIHNGSFPAFWLFGGDNNYYNEIDIFEYSNQFVEFDYYKQFTCGIFCNNNSQNYQSYARVYPILPNESTDLRQPHVFACEWLPNRVTWYVDGNVVNEFCDSAHIPHHPMSIKINYAIDNYALSNNSPIWFDGGTMTLDYLKVCKLKTDCNTDVTITNSSGFTGFTPSLKRSIYINPTNEIVVSNNTNIVMRAVESIIIEKGFTIQSGANITFITHDCPE